MKAKQLGSVVFMYPQEVVGQCTVAGSKVISAAGTAISYESRLNTPELALTSEADDWLDEQNVSDIKAMCETIGTIFTLIMEDDSTKEVYFDHSKTTTFKEIKTGICYYHGNIQLIEN